MLYWECSALWIYLDFFFQFEWNYQRKVLTNASLFSSYSDIYIKLKHPCLVYRPCAIVCGVLFGLLVKIVSVFFNRNCSSSWNYPNSFYNIYAVSVCVQTVLSFFLFQVCLLKDQKPISMLFFFYPKWS